MTDSSFDNSLTETISLDIPSILLDIKKQWWSILLTGLASLMLGCSFFMLFPGKEYTSSTVMAISSNSGSVLRNANNANKVASTLTDILNSDVMKRLVAREIGSQGYTAQAGYIADTNLITLSVKADSPGLAFQVLRSVLSHYTDLLAELMADVRLVTVQQPGIPEYPDKSYNLYFVASLTFAAGVAGYACLIALLSVLRDTVKNGSEMRTKVDARLLAAIPFLSEKEKRKGECGDIPLLWTEIMNYRFGESIRIAVTRIMNHMERRQEKVLMVTSVLPDEGKTTCSINIALAMENSGKRVLLLDGDFRNPSVGAALKVDDEHADTLNEALKTGNAGEEILYRIPDTQLYCLTSSQGKMESGLSLSNGAFEKLLGSGREHFDYIVVDSGPVAFVADTELMNRFCDASVLVVAQDNAAVRMVNDAVDMLDENGGLIGCLFKETRKSGGKCYCRYGSPYRQIHGIKEDR